MRIAIVQAGLGAGGAERVVMLLAADRLARGDEVHLLAFVEPGTASYFPPPRGLLVHELGLPPQPSGKIAAGLGSARRLLRLRRALRGIGPDLVLSFLGKINVLTLLSTRGLGVPVIVSERNNPALERRHWLWRPLGMLLSNTADGLVMQTEAIRRSLPAGARRRSVVIPNPCPPAPMPGLPARSKRVVAVGRLVEQKGFDLLIRAFATVAGKHPGWTLTIYGEGPERRSLRLLAEHQGIAREVELAGVTDRPGAWIAGAALFVLSSRFEGFPNVLIEALAAGLPTIACDCPFGPSDIMAGGTSGLLVPPDDERALADALDRMMGDGELRARFAAAAPAAVVPFAPARVMAAWDEVLTRASARRPLTPTGTATASFSRLAN